MRLLFIVPYFGEHKYPYLEKLLPSLGVAYPGKDALAAATETVIPFAYGDIFLRNNNAENIGFTKACNRGMRYAMERDYDAIWLGNDDLEFPDIDAAAAMLEQELAEHPETGVIGCKICYTDEPDFIYHGGTTRAYPTGLHKWGSVSKGDLNERSLERWVAGGCMIITRRCAQEIGLLDEGFFNIASDSDYGYRARAAGFDVVYVPITVLHPRGSMTQVPSAELMEKFAKDIRHFEEKWMTGTLFRHLDEDPLE